MKKAILIPLLIIFVMIAGLGFAVYWQFKGFQESSAKANLPQFKMPEIEPEIWFGETKDQIEFTSPDGKLKIIYPAYWMEMQEEPAGNFFREAQTEKAEILLFAYRVELGNPILGFLVVQELNLEKNLEKAIEEMGKDIERKEGEMKVINLKIEGREAEFEAEYKSKNGNIFYSKEKLIYDKSFYSVAVFSPKNDWSKIKEEANQILDSVELIP